MQDFIPDIAVRVIGAEAHKAGITLLFELLQHPKLNKQVGIILLLTHTLLHLFFFFYNILIVYFPQLLIHLCLFLFLAKRG